MPPLPARILVEEGGRQGRALERAIALAEQAAKQSRSRLRSVSAWYTPVGTR